MNLIDHLALFADAMDDYHDLLVAEAAGLGDFQYLAEGAGLRLPEKPRKNVIRIELAIADLRANAPRKARQHLRTVYGAWWEHIGLHDTYIETEQMSKEHVLAHFGDHLTESDFALVHIEVIRGVMGKMAQASRPDSALSTQDSALVLVPDAFSLGVALHVALREVETLIS